MGLGNYCRCICVQAANITKERLASFDRPIVSEPKFTKSQCEGLKRDLTAYLQTLKVRLCPCEHLHGIQFPQMQQ